MASLKYSLEFMQEYYYAVFAFHNVLEFQGKNHFQSQQPLQSFYRTLYIAALAHFADHAPLFGTSNRLKALNNGSYMILSS